MDVEGSATAEAAAVSTDSKPLDDEKKQQLEFRVKAQRMADSRAAMPEEERLQCEGVADMLKKDFQCRHCREVLLEPWIVKDCGHLYCYDCLLELVEQKTRFCPECGAGGGTSESWSIDSFGWFSVALLADGSRRVIREGAKFVYDDSVDSLVRLLWPNRVEDYVRIDQDRERRRMEDAAARKTFEKDVQDDRLAQPSSTNPNMAAGRLQPQRMPRAFSSRDNNASLTHPSMPGGHLGAGYRIPPRVERPAENIVINQSSIDERTPHPSGHEPGLSGEAGDDIPAEARYFYVLLMPVQCSAEPAMSAWMRDQGLLDDATELPALMRPYLNIDITRASVMDVRNIVAYLLREKSCLHDSHAHPVEVDPSEVDIYVDWAATTVATPEWLRTKPLPQRHELLLENSKDYSLLSVANMLAQQGVHTDPTIDLVYCRRPVQEAHQ